MSYCLNPACPNPENLAQTEICQACGSKLLLHDRYRIAYAIGQGGFGATFLARNESLPGKPSCVIKQLRPTASAPHVLEMARELFAREAKTLGKIGNHPHLPQLLDYFEANNEFYLVQEYVSGATLQQEVKQGGPFSEAGVKQFLSEIAPILQYIHSQRVIHRDIKPGNIIRRSHDRRLVLIDFGAVKDQVSQSSMNGTGSDQTALTNFAIGTPGFAPPEQLALRPVYASDIYALGVTCIYLLTAKSPKDLDYNPSTGEMMWQNHVDLSDHFSEVLSKMLEVSVRHRYQSAGELLRALDLVPYMDSLKENLLTSPQEDKNNNGPSSGPTSSPSAPSLTVAQMAQSIRARKAKAKQSGNTGFLAGGNSPRGNSNPRSAGRRGAVGNSGGKRKANKEGTPVPLKWDAKTLQEFYAKGKRDFASQDFTKLNLQRITLAGASFHDAKLGKTNLQGANLSKANFGRASLGQSILRDANLAKAYFSHADLQGTDLRGADLTGAYLSNANLRGANLCGANLTGAAVSEEQLSLAKTNWMTVLPSGKRGFR